MGHYFILKNNQLQLSVATLGASITHLRLLATQTDILRSTKQFTPYDVTKSGLFPMVPFANRIRNNQFIWEGMPITWPIHNFDVDFFLHGDGWTKEWQILSLQSESIKLGLESVIADICHYYATINYKLIDSQLIVILTLENLSPKPFPFGMGLHPFFEIENGTTLQFEHNGMWLEDKNYLPNGYTTEIESKFDFRRTQEIHHQWINNGYDNWHGKATLSRLNNLVVTMQSDVPVLQLFQPNTDLGEYLRFICLEPQTHAVDAHNSALHSLKILQQHENIAMTMSITLS